MTPSPSSPSAPLISKPIAKPAPLTAWLNRIAPLPAASAAADSKEPRLKPVPSTASVMPSSVASSSSLSSLSSLDSADGGVDGSSIPNQELLTGGTISLSTLSSELTRNAAEHAPPTTPTHRPRLKLINSGGRDMIVEVGDDDDKRRKWDEDMEDPGAAADRDGKRRKSGTTANGSSTASKRTKKSTAGPKGSDGEDADSEQVMTPSKRSKVNSKKTPSTANSGKKDSKKQSVLNFGAAGSASKSAPKSSSTGSATSAIKNTISSASVSNGSSSSSKKPILQLTSFPSGSATKKPKRVTDDLAPEMLPFQKQFPALKRVPDTSLSALSFEDRFDLYTFVEFWNRYAERLFQLNYEATTLTYAQLEYYITNPDLEFEKVASFYVAFIKVMWPALQTNIGTVQARLAYTFTESDGHDLHTTFKTFQWRDIPPKTHVRALMTLLQVLLETEDFREVMRTIKEHLQEMRTNRWVGLMRRKEVKAIIENLDKEILDHDHQIAQTDNDRASSETAKDSEDAEGSDWASRGGTAVRRQVEKDKQDKVRKQSAEKRLAAAKLVKERNILVTKLHKSQAELAKLERDEEEWQSKYDVVFDQVTATHKRRIGLDRLGRMYWLMEIRKRPAVAVEADAEAAVDSLPKDEAEPVANEGEAELAEQFKSPSNSPRRAKNSKGKEPAIVEEPDIVGIIIEDTKYEWHSEPVAILPMFDRTNGGRKDNVPDSCQNISLPPPPPKVTAKLKVDFHYIDSVSLLTRLFRALNPLGLREKELRNGLKSFFPDVLESTLKTTTKTREADRILKAFGKWVEGKVVGPPDEIQSQREPIAEGVKKAAKGSQEVMKEYVTDTITYFAQSCDMANDDERIANVLNLLFPATTTPTLPTEEQPTEEQPAEEQPTSTEAAAAPTQSLSEALKAAMDAMHSWLTAIPTLTPEAITKAEQVPTLSSLAAWCADIQDEIDRERANRAALEKKSGRRDKRKTPVSATSSPALAVTAVAGDDVKGSSDLEGSAKGSSSTRGTRGTRGTRSSGRRVVGKYNELDDAEFAALIDDDKPEEVKTRPTRSRGNTHGRYRIDSDSGGDEDLGERRRSSRLRAITPTQTSAIRDSSSSDIDLETLQRRRMLRAAAAAGESQSPKAPTNGSAVEEQFGQVSENDDDADSMATKSTTHDPMEIDSTPSTPPVVRRPRGRPRKNPIKDIEVLESPSVQESEPPIVQEEQPQEVRRGRARQPPPSVQEEQPQEVRRPRGRPRKHPIKDVQVSEPPSAPSAPSSVQEEDVETDTEELEAEEEYSEELEEEDDEIPEEEEDDDD